MENKEGKEKQKGKDEQKKKILMPIPMKERHEKILPPSVRPSKK